MVQHDQVGGQEHAQLRDVQVVVGKLGQALEAAHDVVREVADQAAGQRWEILAGVRGTRAGQRADRVAQHGDRVAVDGYAVGWAAQPHRPPVALGQRGDAAHADERVP